VRSWCVKVPKHEGESARKKLLEQGLLDTGLRVRRDGDHLLLPVVSPSFLGVGELLMGDFEEARRPQGDYRKLLTLPHEMMGLLPTSYDVVGDIALIRLPDELLPFASEIGEALRRTFPRLRAVVLDRGVEGEFRVRGLEVISGEGPLVTVHTEFGLRFRVDLERAYFNPRLSGERSRVAGQVKPGAVVIDMFAGVGPFSIMIAKMVTPVSVHAIDINPAAIALLRENIGLNGVEGVVPHLGDAREVVKGLPKADRVIMNLPHSSLDFLPEAARSLKKGGRVHLYMICRREEARQNLDRVLEDLTASGIRMEPERMEELKTYSPSMSVYSVDLVLIDRAHQGAQG